METAWPRLEIALPESGTADPHTWFSQPVDQVHLEIGFGGGEHLAARAAANPGTGFLGAEPFLNRVAKLVSRIEEDGLSNLRLLMGDARDLLGVIEPGSLSRVYLLYPDPWPKKRHNKRRFIGADTLDLLAAAMQDGAILQVATDIPDYCRWTLEHLRAHPDFDWQAKKAADWRDPPAGWPGTRYEAKALREGRRPMYLAFRRRTRTARDSGGT